MLLASMRYPPNIDSARYFCRAIWPLIRTERPSARLVVIGDHAPAAVGRELGSVPGTEIREPSRDIAQELARATLIVVPLRAGAGTRIKVLEALAAQKPVVSTTVGCEGLDVISGRHVIVSDRPADFAESVVALLRDPELRRQLAVEGLALVTERYRWQSAVAVLEAFCDRLAAGIPRTHTCERSPVGVGAGSVG